MDLRDIRKYRFLKKEKHNSFATNHFDKVVVARHPRK